MSDDDFEDLLNDNNTVENDMMDNLNLSKDDDNLWDFNEWLQEQQQNEENALRQRNALRQQNAVTQGKRSRRQLRGGPPGGSDTPVLPVSPPVTPPPVSPLVSTPPPVSNPGSPPIIEQMGEPPGDFPFNIPDPAPRNTYDSFFEKIGKYLLDDRSNLFKGAAEKKALHIALQTIERLNNEEAIQLILSNFEYDENLEVYENLTIIKQIHMDELSPDQHKLMDDWILNKRHTIKDLYKSSTRQVTNKAVMEKTKHYEGYLKRINTPILETNMANFDTIYNKTKDEVLPVYWTLYRQNAFKDLNDNLSSVKQLRMNSLRGKTDDYIKGIISEYFDKKEQIDLMFEGRETIPSHFQINDQEQRYIWPSQMLRLNQFDSVRAKGARTSELELDKSGQEYTRRIQNVNDNVKSFILGGDDKLMRAWYAEQYMLNTYTDLKASWKEFITRNKINLRFTMMDDAEAHNKAKLPKNCRVVCDSKQVLMINNKPFDFDDIETFLRMIATQDELRSLLYKLKEIYDEDLHHYTLQLLKSTSYRQIFQYNSRYGVMNASKELIYSKLPAMSDESKDSIINNIDFLGYAKRTETRARSLRPKPRNNTIDGLQKAPTHRMTITYKSKQRKSPKK